MNNKRLINTLFLTKKTGIAALLCLFVILLIAAFNHKYSPLSDNYMRSETKQVLGVKSTPSVLSLKDDQLKDTYVSPVFKADFGFNALAPLLTEESDGHTHYHIEIKLSNNRVKWTDWLELELDRQLRDDAPNPDILAPESPLLMEGRYFQYRITLERESLAQASPVITDLKINYANTRRSLVYKAKENIQTSAKQVFASGNGGPEIISRAAWGNPDPYGQKHKGTNRYWRPHYSPTEQVFLHHTATESVQSDPEAVMRAIWDYHANTLGWGDIGYNYVVDYAGNIYEGRFGGDNVTAGHVYNYNQRSLGVAVLGCFQPNSSLCHQVNSGNTNPPTSESIDSLVDLLSWKTTSFEIDPQANHNFCDFRGDNCSNIPTIAAHRDAHGHGYTECNGQLFYDMTPDIRQSVADKNSQNTWGYAAKQLSYNRIDVRDEEVAVTLQFKNTGSEMWTNDGDRILLKTTYPDGRNSRLTGSDWIDGYTLTTTTENTVAPGETGNFTFQLNRSANTAGTYLEGLRLSTESGVAMSNMFAMRVVASLPHPEGTLVRQAGDTRVYLIDSGERRHVASRSMFESHGFDFGRVYTATVADLELPVGNPVRFREGTLIQGSNAPVYVVSYDQGTIQKRHIVSRSAFENLGYSFDDVLKISDGQLPEQDGDIIDSESRHPDGTLVREDGDPKVYLLENGERRHVASRRVFESHGLDFDQVRIATEATLALPEGSRLDLRGGTLVQGSGNPIYVVSYDQGTIQKRHIASRRVFDYLSYSFDHVIKVSDGQLPEEDGARVE